MIFMTKHSPVACLSKAALFTDLPIELKEKLIAVSEHQQRFPKGSIIRQPDDGKDGMIVIDQGKAKVYNLSKDGKEVVLGILQKATLRDNSIYSNKAKVKTLLKLWRTPGFAQLTAQIFKNFCRKHQICH